MEPIIMYRRSDGSPIEVYDFKYINDRIYGICWSPESLQKSNNGWVLLLMKNLVPNSCYLEPQLLTEKLEQATVKEKKKTRHTTKKASKASKIYAEKLYEEEKADVEDYEKWLDSIEIEDL